MEVIAVPMLKDNLGYFVRCKMTNRAFFVDISHSSVDIFFDILHKYYPIIFQSSAAGTEEKNDFIVLTTHKHADHSGGNIEAAERFYQQTGQRLIIYGDGSIDQTPGITHSIGDNDSLQIGNLSIQIYQTPCHTRGSLCYHVTLKDSQEGDNHHNSHPGALFTGDTLFVGGIGAFFEGNSRDMVAIFQRLVSIIPRETIIYCGHDYALNFLPNALLRDPTNEHIRKRLEWAQHHRDHGIPAMPTTFKDELETNLFLRVVSHPTEMALLYPQWNPHTDPLDQLMSLVYDTV